MLNSVLMLLARDRYVSDGCEEAMAQGLAESYGRRWGYCYPNAQTWPPRAPNGLPDTPGVPRSSVQGWTVFPSAEVQHYAVDSKLGWMEVTCIDRATQ
jgi:hypothetical protein